MMHQGHNFRVSTIQDKGKEGVEEDTDKLDHLKSCQVPAHYSCDCDQVGHIGTSTHDKQKFSSKQQQQETLI